MNADPLFSGTSRLRNSNNDQLEQHEKQSSALVCHTSGKSKLTNKRGRRVTACEPVVRLRSAGRFMLPLAPLDDLLYRLKANIEQGDLAAGHSAQTALDCFAHFAGIFDLFSVTIERFDNLRVLRTRGDVQAGEILGFHRPAVRIKLRNSGFL